MKKYIIWSCKESTSKYISLRGVGWGGKGSIKTHKQTKGTSVVLSVIKTIFLKKVHEDFIKPN